MKDRTEAYRMANHWEKQLQRAIRRRHEILPGRHVMRQNYREWVRHCRKQADLWEEQANLA